MLWIARDPVLWHAVGIFSATFLYSIAAIAWIERDGRHGTPFVSSWLVIVLLLASVGMFIALIEKISLLQIHRMLAFTADQGRHVIADTYPPLDAPVATPDAVGIPAASGNAHPVSHGAPANGPGTGHSLPCSSSPRRPERSWS